MKQKWIRSDTPQRLFLKVSMVIFFLSISAMLTSCFLKQDRTTTVYGTITDENGLPVDSILVIVQGTKYLTYEDLGSALSNEKGEYEIVTDVPKRFNSVNSGIPSGSLENGKFEKYYVGYDVDQDGKPATSCCFSSIGKKTKYDFQLIPR